MISKKSKNYCCEDLSLIENYIKAINDETQSWECHHRLEIDLNLSRAELIKRDLYFNRPASELIFLTHAEHQRMHKLIKPPIKNHRKESKQLISISSSNRNWLNNGITRAFVKPEENDYYFERGYHLGFKL